MNLLARRAQIRLAADGAHLLKGKREALLKELIKRARELRTLRGELHRRGREAGTALAMARAVRGTPELRSAAVAGRRDIRLEVRFEKLWGLELSTIRHSGDIVRSPDTRGIGLLDSPAHVQEAMEAVERMLEQLLKCGPIEHNIELIGGEIRDTSRRINALEEHLLPKLRSEVRTISRVLEEREREDIFRLKRIKAKRSAGSSPGTTPSVKHYWRSAPLLKEL